MINDDTKRGEVIHMALSTKEVAAELETTPRTLRKFLRSAGLGVGQGSRYSIEKREIRSLTKRFAAWNEARAQKDAEEAQTDEVPAGEDEAVYDEPSGSTE
jgi:hypothetical protein